MLNILFESSFIKVPCFFQLLLLVRLAAAWSALMGKVSVRVIPKVNNSLLATGKAHGLPTYWYQGRYWAYSCSIY